MRTDSTSPANDITPLLRVRDLSKTYGRRGHVWKSGHELIAASEVCFEILPGQTLALVGQSGSGKSTVARCVARLEKPDNGEIWLGDTDFAKLRSKDLRQFRPQIQLVFQDPSTAMNPRFTAVEVVAEPLIIQKNLNRPECHSRARELMQEVGISPDWANRSIEDFSGGQKQRLAIARALALKPQVLILDEALSGLDLLTEAQIANLLLDLQQSYGIAYLLISHDLALVSRLADTIAVMANGKVVEQGPAGHILAHPVHAATRRLVDSAQAGQVELMAMGVAR